MQNIAIDTCVTRAVPLGLALTLVLALSSCGGTKMLSEPESLRFVLQPISATSDQFLSASLDWIIFRDGPGSWATNVDWDEYLISVRNLGGGSMELTNITVVDSLGVQIESRHSRKQLVDGSKRVIRRYENENLEVRAGLSGTVLVGAGAAGVGTLSAFAPGMMMSTASAVGVLAVVTAVPVLAVAGVTRGINNSKVNHEIESRQTLLPIILQEKEEGSLDLFFPLSPSPAQVELTYNNSQGEHKLIIDTGEALNGLHLGTPSK